MLQIEVTTPSPDPSRQVASSHITLADLSRNASVISSSSSSSASDSVFVNTPRPRPIRQFSSPRSRSPHSPTVRSSSKPPAYLTKELGVAGHGRLDSQPDIAAQAQSSSRNSSAGRRISANDFEFGEILGEGSYSTVMHAIYPPNGHEYAIKILDKGHLKRNNKLQTALAEKNTLVRLGSGHPGIVRLHWSFHDEWSLYFVLDLAKNGELQTRIARLGSLSTPCARYYAAQTLDAVEYMHSKGVIHRDLKPENLLLDDAMRIKITDFGTGKILEPGVDKAKSFVGTPQYFSPELLEANVTSRSSDLWALGCIIYQMIAGRFPFHGLSEYLTWQKIKRLEYSFPEGFDEQARDLVQKLLVLNPDERLGAGIPGSSNDMRALRSHPFFASIEWDTLWTAPAPRLEAGLVKKEHPLANELDANWDYVGAAWDDMVSGRDPDEISWASSEGIAAYAGQGPNVFGLSQYAEVGPKGEIPSYETDMRLEEAVAVNGRKLESAGSGPIDVPRRLGDTHSIGGSTTSSSEGSPIDRLGAAVEALELNRGRDRGRTPIQGNGSGDDHNWSSLLKPGEIILLNSKVEMCTRGRRLTASRLFPIPVTPRKTKKARHLILTTHRLVCLKQKKGRTVVIKTESVLERGLLEKGKEREAVVSVESRGENEFVVATTGKPQSYVCEGSSLVTLWVSKIREALRETRDRSQDRAQPTPEAHI